MCAPKSMRCCAGAAEAGVLMRLLLRTARPLLSAVEAWVGEGRLPDTHSEFFIAAGALCPNMSSHLNQKPLQVNAGGEHAGPGPHSEARVPDLKWTAFARAWLCHSGTGQTCVSCACRALWPSFILPALCQAQCLCGCADVAPHLARAGIRRPGCGTCSPRCRLTTCACLTGRLCRLKHDVRTAALLTPGIPAASAAGSLLP